MFRQQAISALTDLNSIPFAEGGGRSLQNSGSNNGPIRIIAKIALLTGSQTNLCLELMQILSPGILQSRSLIDSFPQEPLVDNYVHSL
jgi:hypothetical protein